MKGKSSENAWYEIPDGALVILGGNGRHWVHLQTAEQLAQALSQCLSFDIRRVYRAGGISDGFSADPEGLVALRSAAGQLLVMGAYIAGDLQWPASPADDSAVVLRQEYASDIDCLIKKAAELLPVAKLTPGPKI